MESVEISEFKGFRTSLRTLDELIRLVELSLEEVERRISFIEARARGDQSLGRFHLGESENLGSQHSQIGRPNR